MLKFKTAENINEEVLNCRALKRMKLAAAAGLAVIILDLLTAGSMNSLDLVKDEKGTYIERPASGLDSGHMRLHGDVDDRDYSSSFDITLDSIETKRGQKQEAGSSETDEESGKMSEKELAAYEMRSVVNSLNEDRSIKRVYLPDSLSTGEKIRWSAERKTNTAAIAFAVILMVVFIYRNRLTPLRRQMEAEQDSITRQLPEFINRLVLLLNAGLVLNSAFDRAVEEGFGAKDNDYFFGRMLDIQTRVRRTNGSTNLEFREFARSRRAAGGETSRELMRISNIISDNVSKGVELTDKLQRESEILWLARKRNCEERGRLAETKLTLPLTLFLLILIVITVSPALLEL